MQESDGGAALFLGSRLRKWRKAIPLKAYALAKKIKISQGSLSDIENNNSLPSADTIAKLYRFTDINIIWLLTGAGNSVITGKEKNEKVDMGVVEDEQSPFEIHVSPRVKKLLVIFDE